MESWPCLCPGPQCGLAVWLVPAGPGSGPSAVHGLHYGTPDVVAVTQTMASFCQLLMPGPSVSPRGERLQKGSPGQVPRPGTPRAAAPGGRRSHGNGSLSKRGGRETARDLRRPRAQDDDVTLAAAEGSHLLPQHVR